MWMFEELFIKLLQQGLHSVLKGKDGSPEMVNKWEPFFLAICRAMRNITIFIEFIQTNHKNIQWIIRYHCREI